MNDQLRKRGIEQPILVRQLLGDATLDLDPGMATPSGRDEQLRGIDSTHRASPKPLDQLLRQRAWAAAHIERPLTGDDAGELGEPGRQRHRRPAHEPVVLIGSSVEAHARNLGGDVRPCPTHLRPISSLEKRCHRSVGRSRRDEAMRSCDRSGC